MTVLHTEQMVYGRLSAHFIARLVPYGGEPEDGLVVRTWMNGPKGPRTEASLSDWQTERRVHESPIDWDLRATETMWSARNAWHQRQSDRFAIRECAYAIEARDWRMVFRALQLAAGAELDSVGEALRSCLKVHGIGCVAPRQDGVTDAEYRRGLIASWSVHKARLFRVH
jgi:hypothetical protein